MTIKQKKNTLTNKNIKKYLIAKKIVEKCSVRQLNSGLSNRNFLVISEKNRYNARTNKKRCTEFKNSLHNESVILTFLGKEKITFSPRSIYYDSAKNIHVVQYVKGRQIYMKGLGDTNIKKVLKHLYIINSLAFDLKKYCEKNKIRYAKPVGNKKLLNSIKKKLKYLENERMYNFAVKWATKKIEEDWENIKVQQKEIFLNHGDPVSNVIANGKQVSLIDWEHAGLSYDPGLANIFLHGELNNQKKKRMVTIYAKLSGNNYEKLLSDTLKRQKQLMIENIVDICEDHLKDRRLRKDKRKLDVALLKGRIKYYDRIFDLLT
ncbi:MAG: hypothetical protein KAS07_02410 [Candidatus Pacebacteria bacterium]|nr:hypothetical protein [Candidatus Paceibacterota bacterium]